MWSDPTVDFIKKPESHSSINHAYHLYPLQIDFEKLPITKPEFFDKMKLVGINLQVHYIPVHLQPFYRKLGFQEGNFPEAEAYGREAISLPLYPDLTDDKQNRVIATLKDFIECELL